jgi:hypothetical protein
VACDSTGNIYAVGYEGSSTNNIETIITKWNTSGALIWQRKISGGSDDRFNGVACDTSGNVYAVGNESSTVGNNEALITKWPSDVSSLPNGSLVGAGLTSLSIVTPTLATNTTSLTGSATTLATGTTTLTVSTTTLTVATDTLTRYFSTF